MPRQRAHRKPPRLIHAHHRRIAALIADIWRNQPHRGAHRQHQHKRPPFPKQPRYQRPQRQIKRNCALHDIYKSAFSIQIRSTPKRVPDAPAQDCAPTRYRNHRCIIRGRHRLGFRMRRCQSRRRADTDAYNRRSTDAMPPPLAPFRARVYSARMRRPPAQAPAA